MIDASDSDHVEEIYGLLNLGLQGSLCFCCQEFMSTTYMISYASTHRGYKKFAPPRRLAILK